MKLIIFDKDQTLVRSACGKKFIQHPQDQMIMPGAAEAVQNYHNWGFKIAIASNQGGVEKGKKTLESAIAEMKYCLNLFPEIEFGLIAHTYDGKNAYHIQRDIKSEILIHLTNESLEHWGGFRKPHSGMINYCLNWFKTSPKDCWFVGDRPEDEQAAKAAGVYFIGADIVRDRFLPGFKPEMVCKKVNSRPSYYNFHQN